MPFSCPPPSLVQVSQSSPLTQGNIFSYFFSSSLPYHVNICHRTLLGEDQILNVRYQAVMPRVTSFLVLKGSSYGEVSGRWKLVMDSGQRGFQSILIFLARLHSNRETLTLDPLSGAVITLVDLFLRQEGKDRWALQLAIFDLSQLVSSSTFRKSPRWEQERWLISEEHLRISRGPKFYSSTHSKWLTTTVCNSRTRGSVTLF